MDETDRPPFSKLFFGEEDPYFEVQDFPDRFVRSFTDPNGQMDKIISGRLTLVLGPKGTGKSALAYYLERTSHPLNTYLAEKRTAEDIPLGDIPHIQTGQAEGRQRTVTTWTFLLLANYLDVALKDADARVRGIREIRRVLGILRETGFMAGHSGQILSKFTGTTFALNKEGTGLLFKEMGDSIVTIFSLIPMMTKWAKELRSPNRHILLLDGLDSIFLNDPKYDESLAGLMQAAASLNRELREADATGSIVLLLRNDIFHRVSLRLTDAHKQRAAAYDLDWRTMAGAGAEHGPLLTMVNQKARQGIEGLPEVDVLSYFPDRLGRTRKNQRGRPRLKYLTNFTRHTPRDFLQLMEYIRREAERCHIDDGRALTRDIIREGIIQYSMKYFISAIRGEFVGYPGGPEIVEDALKALKLMPRNEFTRSEYGASLERHTQLGTDKADEFLDLFFRAGAIGNLFEAQGGAVDLVFYHRRDDVSPDLTGKLVLHNALIHAWSRSGGSRLA